MKVIVLSHSYPGRVSPWITPFIRDLVIATAKEPNLELHVLIPRCEVEDTQGVIFHFFRLSSSNPIPHKGLGASLSTVSLWHKIEYTLCATISALCVVLKERIEIVHAHWALPSGFVAYCVSKLLRRPFIVTVHGRDVLEAPKFGYGLPNSSLFRYLLKLVLKGASRIVATSPTMLRATKKLCQRAVVDQIPVGIYQAPNYPFEGEMSEKSAILFLGDLIPRKGVDILLAAVDSSELLRGLQIIIAGDGAERSALEQEAHRRSLNVEFRGRYSPKDLRDLLNVARVVAVPSHVEGFGIVVLEALYAGVPVVGTNCGVLEILNSDPVLHSLVRVCQAGDITALQIQMEELYFSKPKLELDQIQSRLTELFDWGKIGTAHVSLYKAVLCRG